jgi:hypothetical protein
MRKIDYVGNKLSPLLSFDHNNKLNRSPKKKSVHAIVQFPAKARTNLPKWERGGETEGAKREVGMEGDGEMEREGERAGQRRGAGAAEK